MAQFPAGRNSAANCNLRTAYGDYTVQLRDDGMWHVDVPSSCIFIGVGVEWVQMDRKDSSKLSPVHRRLIDDLNALVAIEAPHIFKLRHRA